MFYQNQYKKLHLLSYVCLLGSFFLAPVLRAESSAIKNEKGIAWLEHARKGEVEEMEKLLEENPNYLTWQHPSNKATALIIASDVLQVEVVKMLLSKLSKEQGDHLNVKFRTKTGVSYPAILGPCLIDKEDFTIGNVVEKQEKAAMIVEAVINKAKQYKIKLDLIKNNKVVKNLSLLMLACSPQGKNFKIAELLLDSYKEIGLDLNASAVVDMESLNKMMKYIEKHLPGNITIDNNKKIKEGLEDLKNDTALTLLVKSHLKDKEAAAKGQEDSLADQMKKRKEIIKKLLHLGAHLDEKSKSLAEKDNDLLQFMESEVKKYKFWKNVKIGAWITGGIVLLASLIGGAYWFFVQKPKSESQKA